MRTLTACVLCRSMRAPHTFVYSRPLRHASTLFDCAPCMVWCIYRYDLARSCMRSARVWVKFLPAACWCADLVLHI
jgi:hypothetical protein